MSDKKTIHPQTIDDIVKTDERVRGNHAWNTCDGGVRGLMIRYEDLVKENEQTPSTQELEELKKRLETLESRTNPEGAVSKDRSDTLVDSVVDTVVNNGKDESEKKQFIPTPEVLKETSYGFLYLEESNLKYFDLTNRCIYNLMTLPLFGRKPTSVFADDEDIYFNHEHKIKGLFTNFETKEWEFNDEPKTMLKYEGRILTAGEYGLYDASGYRILINEERLKKRNINAIESLMLDVEGNLYTLVKYNDNTHGVLEIKKWQEGEYKLGNSVFSYPLGSERKKGHTATIVPFGTTTGGKDNIYNFSILSTLVSLIDMPNSLSDLYRNNSIMRKSVNNAESGVYLNNTKIVRIPETRNLSVLSIKDKEAVVLCSSYPMLSTIFSSWEITTQLKIDLKTCTVLEKEQISIKRDSPILSPVYSSRIHERIKEEYSQFRREYKSQYNPIIQFVKECVVIDLCILFTGYLIHKGC